MNKQKISEKYSFNFQEKYSPVNEFMAKKILLRAKKMLCNRILFLSIPYGERQIVFVDICCIHICGVRSYVVQTNGIDNYRM